MDSGFHVRGFQISHPKSGWIPDFISWILDSMSVDSGFHIPNVVRFRILSNIYLDAPGYPLRLRQ